MPDAVAIGFVWLFSNSLLLGLADHRTRLWAGRAGQGNYAIISIHAPHALRLRHHADGMGARRGQGLSLGRGAARAQIGKAPVAVAGDRHPVRASR
jgi:malonate transporter